jgi:hypothetical protein
MQLLPTVAALAETLRSLGEGGQEARNGSLRLASDLRERMKADCPRDCAYTR